MRPFQNYSQDTFFDTNFLLPNSLRFIQRREILKSIRNRTIIRDTNMFFHIFISRVR